MKTILLTGKQKNRVFGYKNSRNENSLSVLPPSVFPLRNGPPPPLVLP